MENNVTVPGEKTPEQIQAEMATTRESLTEKVAALQDHVTGTVQTAADTLSGTVESVKSLLTNAPGAVSDTVKQAAEAVTDTVKKAFDVSGYVRGHPLTAVGVSAGLGFLTGLLIFRGRPALGYSDDVAPPPRLGAPTPTTRSAAAAAPGEPGLFHEMFSMIGQKLRQVAENAIDTATAALNKNVSEGVPKLVDSAAEMAAERLTPGAGEPAPRFRPAGSYPG